MLAAGDWWGLIVPLMLFVYALIQLISKKAPQAPARKPQRRPPAEPVERSLRPPQSAKGQPPAPASPQGQLNAEIEQFLKRAGERRERPKRDAVPPKAPPKAPLRPLAESRPPRREISSVATSVEKHLSNRGFTDRTEHLADDIVRADEVMEKHLKQAFDRQIGTLSNTSRQTEGGPVTDSAPAVQTSNPASDFATMLAEPGNLRRLVIFNEILLRPEHRW
jgi:hypothetical protein